MMLSRGHITDRYPYEEDTASSIAFPPVTPETSSTPVVGQVWNKGNKKREVIDLIYGDESIEYVVYRDGGNHLHQVSIVSWKRWFREDKRYPDYYSVDQKPQPHLINKVK